MITLRANQTTSKGTKTGIAFMLETFLKDDTGQERNRIQIIHNLIRPMVEQYRGNSIILNINATAKSISKKAINRRERALAEQLLKTEVANEFPGIGRILRENDKSIGETPEETTQIFNNLYVDQYVSKMNMLLKYVKDLNEMDQMQVRIAQNISLSGLATTFAYEQGGHQRFEVINSSDYFWDRGAERYDHTDASYRGRFKMLDPAEIFERFQEVRDNHREAIENFVSTEQSQVNSNVTNANLNHSTPSGRVPIYEVYWKDFEKFTYGWVLDEFGYPYLDRINHTEPGEESPRWTKEDLIPPPYTAKNRRLFTNGNLERTMYVELLRFASFIPGEAIAAVQPNTDSRKKEVSDIPLEWGRAPYQERDLFDSSAVKYPFKTYCWGYIDGEVFSPVDDAINPQRFINRVLSVTESQINNSGGANVVIDKDTVDAQDGEQQVYRDVAQGKPVSIRTKGRGIPNSIGTYDATPKQGTYKMFEMIPLMAGLIQNTSGINEALKGESIGQDQLVGVTDRLIQRGSLMQEPFYHAMARIFVQMHQYTASVGKNLYIDNERELAMAVGDDGVAVLELSKDMRNEDFRVFIKRDNSDEALQKQANQMLMLFLELQLIDKNVLGDLYDRSTPQEVMMAVRESLGAQAESQRRAAIQQQEQAKAQAQEEQELQQGLQEETQKQEGIARRDKLESMDHDLNKIAAKGVIDLASQKGQNTNSIP